MSIRALEEEIKNLSITDRDKFVIAMMAKENLANITEEDLILLHKFYTARAAAISQELSNRHRLAMSTD